MRLSSYIALRFSRTTTKNSFISFINRFSIIGISLGIASLVVVISVMNGLEGQLKKRVLGLVPHISIESTQTIDIPLHLNQILAAQTPFIEKEVILQSRSQISGVLMQGLNLNGIKASILPRYLVLGNWQNLSTGKFNIGISQILANKLKVGIGDKIRVISPEGSTYSPLGRVPSQRLVTIGAIFNVQSEMDDKVAVMNINDLSRLVRGKRSELDTQRLFLFDAFTYNRFTEYLDNSEYQYETWVERQGALFDAVKVEKNMMAIMLLLVVAVASFNVVSGLVMLVAEKQADIAILQTQGMEKREIMMIFILNGIINGLKGLGSGIVLGLLICWQLNNLLHLIGINLAFGENGQGLPIDIQWQQLFIVCVASLSLCLMASVYPAYKAQRFDPANSLRSE